MDLLVTYDIRTATPQGARRLLRVAEVCQQYGVRVQYSVFECRLNLPAVERLVIELEDVIDTTQDSVFLYQFHGSVTQARRALGQPRAREPGDPWIF